jgi:hypothetical protein
MIVQPLTPPSLLAAGWLLPGCFLLVDYEDEDDPIPKLLSELPRRQLELLTSLWGKDNVWWCVS